MLVTTLLHRPYVVAFLVTFLVLAVLHIGLWRTLIWMFWGYAVAFLSEYSSIRNGFPYGIYHYIYTSMPGELVIGSYPGVPIWDSVSYAFIAYASYAAAWFMVEPHFMKFSIDPHVSPSKPLKVALWGSILMMLADVIIDPVSNLGEKWFLGKIYFYPNGGEYFGVPLTNFAGWLLVAFVIITGFQLLEKYVFVRLRLPVWGAKRFPFQALLGPLFYLGIIGFNLVMTWRVASLGLCLVSTLLTAGLITVLFRGVRFHQMRGPSAPLP